MSVFRVEKTKDFTIMSNHHFKNKNLSLNAKGLLSLMLSLPDEWDYTIRGLASICKDGVDSISTALKELEAEGYLIRFGVDPGELHTHWQVIGETQAVVRCLTAGARYYVKVDAYNENGVAPGKELRMV